MINNNFISVEKTYLGNYIVKYKSLSKVYSMYGRKESVSQFKKDFGLQYMRLSVINLK